VENSASIDTLIRPLLQRAEEDGFEGGDFTTQEWLDDARDARRESALAWLLASADRAGLAPGVFRAMYDAVEPPVRWSLARSPASVTHNRLPVASIVPRQAMRRADDDSARAIAAPLPDIQLLDSIRGTAIIDVARAALAARGRVSSAPFPPVSYPSRSPPPPTGAGSSAPASAPPQRSSGR
jgi:hypothetical protein